MCGAPWRNGDHLLLAEEKSIACMNQERVASGKEAQAYQATENSHCTASTARHVVLAFGERLTNGKDLREVSGERPVVPFDPDRKGDPSSTPASSSTPKRQRP